MYENTNSYNANDPYANAGKGYNNANDPYKPNNAYKNQTNNYKRDELAREPVSKENHIVGFWFWLKEQIQFIYSSDIGFNGENRVLATDQDLFRIKILAGIAKRMTYHILLVPLIMIMSFLSFSFNNEITRIISFTFLEFFIVFYLYLPTWQVVSSKEYIVTDQLKTLFRIIYSNFKIYVFVHIGAFLFMLFLLGWIGYNPDFILKANPTVTINGHTYHYLEYIIIFFNKFHLDFALGFKFLASAVAAGFGLYLLFYFILLKIAEDKQNKNDRLIKERTMSEVEKSALILDEF